MGSTWLITGASSGFGASLAIAALNAGHKVLGTARNIAKAQTDYPQIEKNGAKWLQLDVTQPHAESIVAKAVKESNVDVPVNNAGYALKGPLEELDFDRIRHEWETNYFGLLACTKGAIPHFRQRKSGTIVNISSTAGVRALPGYTQYAASKFAVEGVSEALAAELAPFNIRVLIIEPGAFRTNFQAAASRTDVSSAYVGTPADEVPKRISSGHGKQPGDPEKGAQAIVEVVSKQGRGSEAGVAQALRLPLGKDSVQVAYQKMEGWKKDVDAMRHISEWAVFPDA
ncbi:MAG: hypothetical protein Q9162_000812 [Coniocarpon cinnabarinum]